MADRKQLVIIGAGPGGYGAAFQADNLGLDVILIDPRENPGGVCLYEGCIPTKALLHFADTKEEAELFSDMGLEFGKAQINIGKLRKWKEDVVNKLTGGVGLLVKSRKIGYKRGMARLLSDHMLEIKAHDGSKENIEFENLIIATGARAKKLPGADFDGDRIMNAETALELKDIPGKMLIVGAGYIGLEMSVIYKALGTEIEIVELTGNLLPGVDKDLISIFKRERKDLVDLMSFESKVTEVHRKKNKVLVTIENKEGKIVKKEYDRILIAVGEEPNSNGLGLEEAGVKTDDKGFIKIDKHGRTSVNHIYAIGDVTGGAMLAHKANHEGRIAAEYIAHGKSEWDALAIPAIIFTEPEIAWTGLTESEAKNSGRDFKVVKFPWSASGRAITLGRKIGLTKLIFDTKTDRIIGGAAAGKNAGSLISEITLAIEMAAVAKDLELTIHPHPTLSETIMEAAEIYLGVPTHVLKASK